MWDLLVKSTAANYKLFWLFEVFLLCFFLFKCYEQNVNSEVLVVLLRTNLSYSVFSALR